MRTPESYLKQIAKLREQHEANFRAERWQANDTIRDKIITAWAGYHAAIDALLDKSGCASGSETQDYSQPERIRHLVTAKNYFAKRSENLTKAACERQTTK
jgi:hypothetical protein